MEQIKHGFDFEYFDTYICENVIGHTTLFIEYNNENEKSDENISNEIKKMTEKLFSSGEDIEEAKQALQGNKEFFQGKYDDILILDMAQLLE